MCFKLKNYYNTDISDVFSVTPKLLSYSKQMAAKFVPILQLYLATGSYNGIS